MQTAEGGPSMTECNEKQLELIKDRKSNRLCVSIPPLRAPGQSAAERRARRDGVLGGNSGGGKCREKVFFPGGFR
jgi:hypothetical protein